MYQLKLVYEFNGDVITLEHEVRSCHITNSNDFHNCELELPITVSQHYEKLDIKNLVVKNIVLYSNENVVYESEYWNAIKRLHTYFADEGSERCDVELIHAEPEQAE